MNWSEHEFECDRSEDAAAYALGALEDVEAQEYRDHLLSCGVCREQVGLCSPVVDALPVAVPHVSAPEALRGRLMNVVHGEAELLRAAGSEADRPVRSRPRWRLRPLPTLVAAGSALVAGLLVGALVIGGSGSSGVRTHVIRGTVAASDHGASAELREVGSRSELVVANLPAPPLGRIYEVWVQRGDQDPQPTDALFSVTSKGSGSVAVPADLRGASRVMVTAEPLGGSTVPTRSPTIVVQLS